MDIGVVIVTYNRLEKLKTALKSYEKQTKFPSYIIVINNASTDGTWEFLKEWEAVVCPFEKQVLNLEKNVGGSGGFRTGLEIALEKEAEWIWVADDDAFPEYNALEIVNTFLHSSLEQNISAICGSVINQGIIDIGHRKKLYCNGLKVVTEKINKSEYKDVFELNAFSYVGTIIKKEKLLKVGLTEDKYFIWMDDTEHSLRLSKEGHIFCVPDIQVHHDVNEDTGISWKKYYLSRNTADMYRKHFSKYVYYYFCIRTILVSIIRMLSQNSRTEGKMGIEAIKDVYRGKFGMHQLYKPGWHI